MKLGLLDWLACPVCGEAPLLLSATRSEQVRVYSAHPAGIGGRREEDDVVEGSLACPSCQRSYPVVDGIPRLLPDSGVFTPVSAHGWTTFDRAHDEWEQNFLDFMDPLQPADFLGRLVLDAGCGYGRHAFFSARYGAEVVALDLGADAVDAARRNTRDLNRVHVVQGDIHHPPFREGVFDLAYCLGVLHHLEQPREAFHGLVRVLHVGGRLSVWMHGPRQGFAAAVTRGLRNFTTRMEPPTLHRVSQGIAAGLRVFSHTPTRYLVHVPVARHVVTHLPVHDHHRWPFDVVVADVYDRLRVPVTLTLTGEDLERWYEEEGFANIVVTRRVRNNESFRGTGKRR